MLSSHTVGAAVGDIVGDTVGATVGDGDGGIEVVGAEVLPFPPFPPLDFLSDLRVPTPAIVMIHSRT